MDQQIRHDWQQEEIATLFDLPFSDLMFEAQSVHRAYFNPRYVQISTLLNIKTGACPEDCGYCSQSGHNKTGLEKEKLWDVEEVLEAARNAKANGAERFCMGAAWRSPPAKDFPKVVAMVEGVKALGLETCLTAGMLTREHCDALLEAGLDYYNHNLDTSPEYYSKIVSTRCYDDRLETLRHVRESGIKVCCGGILGMGESRADRVSFLQQLSNLPEHPESVPINMLVRIEGTRLEAQESLESFEFVRTIAVARIIMPRSVVRLSAGRTSMSDETQALCFLAGANSIFYGEKLLTTANPSRNHDQLLLKKLGFECELDSTKDSATPSSACHEHDCLAS